MAEYGFQEIKYAVFDEATAARHELVAAVAGKVIVVMWLHLQAADAAQEATIESATTALTGGMDLQSGPLTWSRNDKGWVQTAAGAALNVSLSQAVQVGGVVGYVEV